MPDLKYGFIDRTGKVVIKPQFSWYENFSEGLLGLGQHFIDTNGKTVLKLKTKYDVVHPFTGGLARVEKNGKLGYIDKQGKEVIKLLSGYDRGRSFSDGLAMVKLIGPHYGFIDMTGEEVVKPVYRYVYDFSEGFAAGAIYDRVYKFSEGLAAVSVGGRWGFIGKPVNAEG